MPESKSSSTITITPKKPIPGYMIGEVESKLAYVDELITAANISQNGDLIHLKIHLEIDQVKKIEIESKVLQVVNKMTTGSVKPKVVILEDHMDRPIFSTIDPTPELLKNRELHQEENGIYTLGPLITRLVDFFEDQFISLAKTFGAQPYRFPTLIPARYLERVNYFQAFPHSLTFVTHLREDLDVINHFAEHAACDDYGLNASLDNFDQIKTLLSPAVCYHLYFALADKPLPGDQLAATAVSNCFRYESINLSSLERMWNFTMREIIFVGSKDYVLENREIARQGMAPFFEEIGLAYRVETANDPFFIGEFRKQAAFQTAFQLKFEIRAKLPFKDATLAVGSYNYHQDFFGRHLNIILSDGTPVHTGCVAFGLERIAYAFMAQHGINPTNWPAYVRNRLR